MHMDIQLDQGNHQLPFHSELDQRPYNERWTVDQLESTEKRTLPATYENVPNIPLTHPRRLPPLQPDQSAAPQGAPQRAPFSHTHSLCRCLRYQSSISQSPLSLTFYLIPYLRTGPVQAVVNMMAREQALHRLHP